MTPPKYCKLIKDKNTGESKGIAYAKYDKASGAAVAIEALNGKKISEDQPAFKVLLFVSCILNKFYTIFKSN